MADVKKIATRTGYGEALKELGALHDNIVVFDADLAGSTQTGVFGKAFPDRHFNCGIAEGNMMAVAAGAASMGMVAFASSFAMFAAGRAYEQVRNSSSTAPISPLRIPPSSCRPFFWKRCKARSSAARTASPACCLSWRWRCL